MASQGLLVLNWVVNDDSLEHVFPRNLLLHAWNRGWTADELSLRIIHHHEKTFEGSCSACVCVNTLFVGWLETLSLAEISDARRVSCKCVWTEAGLESS